MKTRKGPRWFRVRIVTEFNVHATGPKRACAVVLTDLRDRMIELDELEFKANEV